MSETSSDETDLDVGPARRDDDPDCQLLRKQVWAFRFPEKFYEGEIDYRWQEEKERLERLDQDD